MGYQINVLILAVCFPLFFSCENPAPGTNQSSTPELDSLLAELEQEEIPAPPVIEPSPAPIEDTDSESPAKITLQDDSKYSKTFLNKLSYSGLANEFELADSLLIVEKLDTFVFPMELPENEWTNFIAVKGGYTLSLDVARLNFSTLGFNYELRKGNQTIDQINGEAHINTGFFLGSESDEDPQTGASYFCDEYTFEKQNCYFAIRLGNDEGIRKVKIIKDCESGKYDIALEDCPVLLEK